MHSLKKMDTSNACQIMPFHIKGGACFTTDANGKLNGLYKSWYPSGNKKIVANYRDDKLDGLYIEYYDDCNSKIKCEKTYFKGDEVLNSR